MHAGVERVVLRRLIVQRLIVQIEVVLLALVRCGVSRKSGTYLAVFTLCQYFTSLVAPERTEPSRAESA